MNSGILVTNYAKALLKRVLETGRGELVCSQALVLEHALSSVPALRSAVNDQLEVPSGEKLKLFVLALGGGELSEELSAFISLVVKNGRESLLGRMLHSFVKEYHRHAGVKVATLRTVVPPTEEQCRRFENLVKARTGCASVQLVKEIDPSLIGGFVLDLDDYIMDASVSYALSSLKAGLCGKNLDYAGI